MKKFAIVILCLFTILGATACGDSEKEQESGGSSVNSGTNGENSNSNSGTSGGTTTSTYSLNQTISYGGAEYKITKLEYNAGNEVNKPADGNQYAMVTIEIRNTSNASVSYSSRNFALTISDGSLYTPTILLSTAELSSGTLEPGQTASGHVTFDIPTSATAQTIGLYTNSLHNEAPVFVVNLK